MLPSDWLTMLWAVCGMLTDERSLDLWNIYITIKQLILNIFTFFLHTNIIQYNICHYVKFHKVIHTSLQDSMMLSGQRSHTKWCCFGGLFCLSTPVPPLNIGKYIKILSVPVLQVALWPKYWILMAAILDSKMVDTCTLFLLVLLDFWYFKTWVYPPRSSLYPS